MQTLIARSPALPLPPLLRTPPPAASHAPLLGWTESRQIESGAWFSALSTGLRQAIVARSSILPVRRGAVLLRRGSPATHWIGVAAGALKLVACKHRGQRFTLDLLGPGDWYGDIALMDGSVVDLDIVAQSAGTLLMLERGTLHALLREHAELRPALLQLDCRRLRHIFRRLEEVHTLPLPQRVALQLHRLLKQFGRPAGGDAQHIALTLTQGDLAELLAASRQRINGVMRQLQAEGVLANSHGRIEVLLPQRLNDVAAGRWVLEAGG